MPAEVPHQSPLVTEMLMRAHHILGDHASPSQQLFEIPIEVSWFCCPKEVAEADVELEKKIQVASPRVPTGAEDTVKPASNP